MRSALYALLIVFLSQSVIVPLFAAEDCAVQEKQHSNDDCSPLCVTCACSPIGHAFEGEIIRETIVGSTPVLAPVALTEAALDTPPREILHVPLAASTL